VSATTSEDSLERQLSIVSHSIVNIFSPDGIRDCTVLLPDKEGKSILQAYAVQAMEQEKYSSDEEAIAALVMAQGQTVDMHPGSVSLQAIEKSTNEGVRQVVTTERKEDHFVRMVPLKIGQRVVGVVRLVVSEEARSFAELQGLGVEREQSYHRHAFFWTFLDQAASIIERARLRQENLQVELLQRTDALRAALLSSVSHDLRTPLASIKAGASSLLQEDVQWDEDARHSFVLAIENEADRLNRLVGNLLDMSRIEGGALKPEKEWYPIDELLHDVFGHMQTLLQGRPVHTVIPDNLPPVELDYLQMDQVLTNLIENAVRYTPSASPIEIGVEVVDGQMMVSVADRGPGIPPEDMERIFDKFYRVLGVQRQGTIGSGLGLAVCRGLVEAHGGRIWAENRLGGGAIFKFMLPLRKVEEPIYE
jgi:two-component system sensor histidine kinase KdpD